MNQGINANRSYVLRKGKFTDAQRRSYQDLFPRYGVNTDAIVNVEKLFTNNNPLVIEIGFGMGRATIAIAEKNRELNYLGIEVHKPGIGRLLWEIETRGLSNIRIIEGDAPEILKQCINDKSVYAFHLFFPDPWPKKRHHKRRLVRRPFTDLLAQKLLNDGYVYMVTDWADYAEMALNELIETAGLKNKYNDFADRQEWRPETEFERKGLLKNHEIKELMLVKNEV